MKTPLVAIFASIFILIAISMTSAYNPPLLNSVNFTLCYSYTPPSSNSINFTLSVSDACVGVTCIPPGMNQDWNIDWQDNCTITQENEINLGTGKIILKGEGGTFTVQQNITAHGLILMPGQGVKLVQMPGARIMLR